MVAGLVQALIGVVIAMELDITADQQSMIMACTSVVVAFFLRTQVTEDVNFDWPRCDGLRWTRASSGQAGGC